MATFKSCYHCKERYLGCHSICPKYLKEKAKWEDEKSKARKDQTYTIYPSDFEMLACMHRPRKDKRRR